MDDTLDMLCLKYNLLAADPVNVKLFPPITNFAQSGFMLQFDIGTLHYAQYEQDFRDMVAGQLLMFQMRIANMPKIVDWLKANAS
jgi:hypothetical protein